MVCCSIMGCAPRAHPPVIVENCRFTTGELADGRHFVTYRLDLRNMSDVAVRATRVLFTNWSRPMQLSGGVAFDYTGSLMPRRVAHVVVRTSPFGNQLHDGTPRTPPPKLASMKCEVLAVRFENGGIWTNGPGVALPREIDEHK